MTKSIVTVIHVCRRKALKRWKTKKDHLATYGNLLRLCVRAGDTQCANVVCEVLNKKCEYVNSVSSGDHFLRR